jgi:LacI family transcriptional regulator, galactose operon repressor
VIWENIYPRGFPFHGAALRLGKAHRMARNATSSTIHDVARAAGVSIATVSKAVNNKGRMRPVTRARVHRIAQELGFRPNDLALSLRRRRSFTVGLLSNDIYGRFALPILGGVEEALAARCTSVFLCNAADDRDIEARHLASLLRKRVDGLVFTARRADSEFPAERTTPRIPIVHVNLEPRLDGPALLADDRGGARLGTAHLAALGRTRIAHVSGPQGFRAVRLRHAGYRDALAQAGLTDAGALFGDWSEAWGWEAVDRLFTARHGATHPDAIFCGSDQIARGVIDALRHLGITVPAQVAIVGFDNWEVLAAGARPALTTVDPCLKALGIRAGETLMGMIDGTPEPSGECLLPCRLTVRASCGGAA